MYELLEEMLDNGFPLATESNILKELIKPPTILRSVVNSITGTAPAASPGLPTTLFPRLLSLCITRLPTRATLGGLQKVTLG